ncbi:branched-chain amino acid ABC transporter permease [Aestuariibius sp. HNIBRBA575]|uniref:branched-chain amino acid ABC transporter permease n=1 Tax=Aestuariibius sp. HNIBRBA575 TaxID=3233343 RepID=UPI0034A3E47A
MLARMLDASNLDPLFVKVLTLVFAEILFLVLSTQKSLANGFNGIRGLDRPFAELIGSYENYDCALAIVLIVLSLLGALGFRSLSASPYGRALRAMRDDPDAAESLGYDIRALRTAAFVFGSTVMVLAGALWPLMTTAVEPSAFKFDVTLLVWAALIMGGTGSAFGPLIGSVLLFGIVHEGARMIHFGPLPPQVIPLIEAGGIGVLMVLFILFRPDGLWRETPLKLSPLWQEA